MKEHAASSSHRRSDFIRSMDGLYCKKARPKSVLLCMAERMGFEPMCDFSQTDFELESLSGL